MPMNLGAASLARHISMTNPPRGLNGYLRHLLARLRRVAMMVATWCLGAVLAVEPAVYGAPAGGSGPNSIGVKRDLLDSCIVGLPLEIRLSVLEDPQAPWRKVMLEERYPEAWQFIDASEGTAARSTGTLTWFFAGKSLEPLVQSIEYLVRPVEPSRGTFARFSGRATLSDDLGGPSEPYTVSGAGEALCDWQLVAARESSGGCNVDDLTIMLTLRRNQGAHVDSIRLVEQIPSEWTVYDISPDAHEVNEHQIVWSVSNDDDNWLERSFIYHLRQRDSSAKGFAFNGEIAWQSAGRDGELPIGGLKTPSCSDQ